MLFTLLSSPCVSKASSAAAKIPPKLLAVRCKAVFAEQIFAQAMKSSKRILAGFARALKQHGRKSARKNRHGFVSRQPIRSLYNIAHSFVPVKFKTDNFHTKLKRIKLFLSMFVRQIRPFEANSLGTGNCPCISEKIMQKTVDFPVVI